MIKTLSPQCTKCRGAEFGLRVMREEAVATAHCVGCEADYLLLDSQDYWFDVIQKGYPRLTRCACKNESFRLHIDCNLRDDGEIDFIEVHSLCSACEKRRRQYFFEVDYFPTGHLLKKPLVACKNPKILYDLKNLHLCLEMTDIFRIVDYLAEEKCSFLSRVRNGDDWVLVRQSPADVKATFDTGKYLFIYAMPRPIEVTEDQVHAIKKEDSLWKRLEVIRIGSKAHVCRYQLEGYPPSICHCSDRQTHPSYTEIGLTLYIDFSNEYVRGEKAISKSAEFRAVTQNLLTMLASEFATWRSPLCFDKPEVHERVYGDEFRKKAEAKKKR